MKRMKTYTLLLFFCINGIHGHKEIDHSKHDPKVLTEIMKKIWKLESLLLSMTPVEKKRFYERSLKLFKIKDSDYSEEVVNKEVIPLPVATAEEYETFSRHLLEKETNNLYVNESVKSSDVRHAGIQNKTFTPRHTQDKNATSSSFNDNILVLDLFNHDEKNSPKEVVDVVNSDASTEDNTTDIMYDLYMDSDVSSEDNTTDIMYDLYMDSDVSSEDNTTDNMYDLYMDSDVSSEDNATNDVYDISIYASLEDNNTTDNANYISKENEDSDVHFKNAYDSKRIIEKINNVRSLNLTEDQFEWLGKIFNGSDSLEGRNSTAKHLGLSDQQIEKIAQDISNSAPVMSAMHQSIRKVRIYKHSDNHNGDDGDDNDDDDRVKHLIKEDNEEFISHDSETEKTSAFTSKQDRPNLLSDHHNKKFTAKDIFTLPKHTGHVQLNFDYGSREVLEIFPHLAFHNVISQYTNVKEPDAKKQYGLSATRKRNDHSTNTKDFTRPSDLNIHSPQSKNSNLLVNEIGQHNNAIHSDQLDKDKLTSSSNQKQNDKLTSNGNHMQNDKFTRNSNQKQNDKLTSNGNQKQTNKLTSNGNHMQNDKLTSNSNQKQNDKLTSNGNHMQNNKLTSNGNHMQNNKLASNGNHTQNNKLTSIGNQKQNDKLTSNGNQKQNDKLTSNGNQKQNDKLTSNGNQKQNDKLTSNGNQKQNDKLTSNGNQKQNDKLTSNGNQKQNDKLTSNGNQKQNDKLTSNGNQKQNDKLTSNGNQKQNDKLTSNSNQKQNDKLTSNGNQKQNENPILHNDNPIVNNQYLSTDQPIDIRQISKGVQQSFNDIQMGYFDRQPITNIMNTENILTDSNEAKIITKLRNDDISSFKFDKTDSEIKQLQEYILDQTIDHNKREQAKLLLQSSKQPTFSMLGIKAATEDSDEIPDDDDTQVMVSGNIYENLNYFEKLVEENNEEKLKKGEHYVDSQQPIPIVSTISTISHIFSTSDMVKQIQELNNHTQYVDGDSDSAKNKSTTKEKDPAEIAVEVLYLIDEFESDSNEDNATSKENGNSEDNIANFIKSRNSDISNMEILEGSKSTDNVNAPNFTFNSSLNKTNVREHTYLYDSREMEGIARNIQSALHNIKSSESNRSKFSIGKLSSYDGNDDIEWTERNVDMSFDDLNYAESPGYVINEENNSNLPEKSEYTHVLNTSKSRKNSKNDSWTRNDENSRKSNSTEKGEKRFYTFSSGSNTTKSEEFRALESSQLFDTASESVEEMRTSESLEDNINSSVRYNFKYNQPFSESDGNSTNNNEDAYISGISNSSPSYPELGDNSLEIQSLVDNNKTNSREIQNEFNLIESTSNFYTNTVFETESEAPVENRITSTPQQNHSSATVESPKTDDNKGFPRPTPLPMVYTETPTAQHTVLYPTPPLPSSPPMSPTPPSFEPKQFTEMITPLPKSTMTPATLSISTKAPSTTIVSASNFQSSDTIATFLTKTTTISPITTSTPTVVPVTTQSALMASTLSYTNSTTIQQTPPTATTTKHDLTSASIPIHTAKPLKSYVHPNIPKNPQLMTEDFKNIMNILKEIVKMKTIHHHHYHVMHHFHTWYSGMPVSTPPFPSSYDKPYDDWRHKFDSHGNNRHKTITKTHEIKSYDKKHYSKGQKYNTYPARNIYDRMYKTPEGHDFFERHNYGEKKHMLLDTESYSKNSYNEKRYGTNYARTHPRWVNKKSQKGLSSIDHVLADYPEKQLSLESREHTDTLIRAAHFIHENNLRKSIEKSHKKENSRYAALINKYIENMKNRERYSTTGDHQIPNNVYHHFKHSLVVHKHEKRQRSREHLHHADISLFDNSLGYESVKRRQFDPQNDPEITYRQQYEKKLYLDKKHDTQKNNFKIDKMDLLTKHENLLPEEIEHLHGLQMKRKNQYLEDTNNFHAHVKWSKLHNYFTTKK